MAARYSFTNSYELATGNWQPDANSILYGLRRLKFIGNRQLTHRYSLTLTNLQLAARFQFDFIG